MVEWLAGKRARGTSSERTASGFAYTTSNPAGWVEVGSAEVTSGTTDTLTIDPVTDARYYMILFDRNVTNGATNGRLRFNNSSSGYAVRYNGNTGTTALPDTTGDINATDINTHHYTGSQSSFAVDYIVNYSTKDKLVFSHATGGADSSAPEKIEATSKWVNSNTINRMDMLNTNVGDFNTGTKFTILRYDPTSTHTTNFWEQLADVNASGSSDTISSGTISAKKWLWVQTYTSCSGSTIADRFHFNGENTGTNYYTTRQEDTTQHYNNSSVSYIRAYNSASSIKRFTNMFILNNGSRQKLTIHHNVEVVTAGTNQPLKAEFAGRWANSTNQITEIEINNQNANNYDTKSFIKVWGAD